MGKHEREVPAGLCADEGPSAHAVTRTLAGDSVRLRQSAAVGRPSRSTLVPAVVTDSVQSGMASANSLYRCEEFGPSRQSGATIIFVCPFDTSIQRVRFAIRRLCREHYRVMAYQTTSAVFTDADPTILPELISQVRGDIRARIAKLKSQDVTDFGFRQQPGFLYPLQLHWP